MALARTWAPKATFQVGSFVSTDLPRSVAVAAVGEVLNYVFDSANDDVARTDPFSKSVPSACARRGAAVRRRDARACAAGQATSNVCDGAHRAVLVETDLESATGLLTRTITSFRLLGSLYRRDAEVHRLALVEPAAVLESLRTIGFEVQAIPRYGPTPLPPGVVAFLARKPVAMPPNTYQASPRQGQRSPTVRSSEGNAMEAKTRPVSR